MKTNAELMQWAEQHSFRVSVLHFDTIATERLSELFKGMRLVPEALQPSGDVVSVPRGDLEWIMLAARRHHDSDEYRRVRLALTQPSTGSDGEGGV